MAKFLPFVVEKSTPTNIYQTLIGRSKGMNNVLVVSIFYLIISKGITAVRKQAEALPELPPNSLYETLLTNNSEYRISNDVFSKMQRMTPYVEKHIEEGEISQELREFSVADMMGFFLVMLLARPMEDFTAFNFRGIFNDAAEAVETNLKKLKMFSNAGSPVFFNSKETLASFIHFYTLVRPDPDPAFDEDRWPVKAVFRRDTPYTGPASRQEEPDIGWTP